MKIKKKGNPKLLISFRNLEEILNQNFDSFDICDLKDTEKGSIGAWDEKNILKAVQYLKKKIKISATIGDVFSIEGILKKLKRFDNFGLDYIKFGINTDKIFELKKLFFDIGKLKLKTKLVLVIFVDKKKILKIIEQNLNIFCQSNIKFFILDTYKKNNQNLTSFCKISQIKIFIEKCSIQKINVGLAGRLQTKHITELQLLNPYVIGFRSAICSDYDRKRLSEEKLLSLSSLFFSKRRSAIERAGAW